MCKYNINKLILFFILLTQNTLLFAMDRNVYYVGVSAGKAFTKIDGNSDNGFLTEVVAGQYFNESDVAFEVAYTELDQYDVSRKIGTSTEETNYDIKGLKLIAAKHFIFNPDWYMSIKGGAIYCLEETETVTKDQTGTTTNSIDDKDRGFNIYIGLGYSYSMTKESRVNLTIERFNTGNGEFANALLGVIFSL